MRAHRNKAEQGVEIEAAQSPSVVAHSEVALGEQRLDHKRQRYSQSGGDKSRHGQRTIQPDDPRNRDHKFKHGTEKLASQSWQEPYAVGAVTAFRHVGSQAAMK